MYKIVIDKLSGNQFGVERTSDGAHVPPDPANTDYQAYLKWLEEGNQPLPADEPNTNQGGL